MCKRCIIFTYDEVLDIVHRFEIGAPLNFNPDWPVWRVEAYPKSVVPLIVPEFDTAVTAPASTLSTETARTPLPTFMPGSLGVRELSWGFEKSWKPALYSIRASKAPRSQPGKNPCYTDAASFPSPHSSRHIAKKPIPRPKQESPSNANTNSVFLGRTSSSSAAHGAETTFPW